MPLPNETAPLTVTPGAIRFNIDSMKLEYYRGGPVGFGTTTQTGEWVNLTTDSPDIQTGGARGLHSVGAATPSNTNNTIDYVTIATTGNAIDFGDLTAGRRVLSSCASSTRGINAGGYPGSPGESNIIDYVTISSTGNAQDFGDLTSGKYGLTACSNRTRGIFVGGDGVSAIDYITIASTGNAVDFVATLTGYVRRGMANSTRGIFAGKESPVTNTIYFVTISTTGAISTFGDLTVARGSGATAANSTRGIYAGGYASPSPVGGTNVIDYITIASLGNATDFGDLTGSLGYRSSGAASPTRMVKFGGYNPGYSNIIDYITISSVGNSIDFGDTTLASGDNAACSNGHGGLG